MNKFKIGDSVKIHFKNDHIKRFGQIGIIQKNIRDGYSHIDGVEWLVKFDTNPYHSGVGRDDDFLDAFREDEMELVNE